MERVRARVFQISTHAWQKRTNVMAERERVRVTREQKMQFLQATGAEVTESVDGRSMGRFSRRGDLARRGSRVALGRPCCGRGEAIKPGFVEQRS